MTATVIKERPILFSAQMIRAILEGRKTQTRRIIKPAPGDHPDDDGSVLYRCPYGYKGDRLWVRESFSYHLLDDGFWYWADGNVADKDCTKPKPSIHMPRRASRISLEVTKVRVERLREISEDDAKAEGVRIPVSTEGCKPGMGVPLMDLCSPYWVSGGKRSTDHAFRCEYAVLWDEINGKGSWAKNPWVWVIEFRTLKAGRLS